MGLFVVFEGVEGSGKSTQSRALKRRLTRAGYLARLIHEPGGTPTGERIRRWLKGERGISPLAELLLFEASRASLVESVIRPALTDGETVVCDRYVFSTLAYQGYGRGLELAMIHQLNEMATGGLLPDIVVLLDIPPEVGFNRLADRRLDRFEREQDNFHQRVRQGYLELAKQHPERWLILDSEQPRKHLSERVWGKVSEQLRRNAPGIDVSR